METKDILALILTLINVILTLRVTFFVKRQEDRAKNYSELDKAFDALLKDAATNPDFRDPGFTQNYVDYKNSDDAKKHSLGLQYEIYAFRCMNFCETIFDTSDIKLKITWVSIIMTESKLHSRWLEQPENQERFKISFRKFIANGCDLFPDKKKK